MKYDCEFLSLANIYFEFRFIDYLLGKSSYRAKTNNMKKNTKKVTLPEGLQAVGGDVLRRIAKMEDKNKKVTKAKTKTTHKKTKTKKSSSSSSKMNIDEVYSHMTLLKFRVEPYIKSLSKKNCEDNTNGSSSDTGSDSSGNSSGGENQ